MSLSWSERDEAAFISLVRSRPVLWDMAHIQFRQLDRKDIIWAWVVNQMNKPGLNVEEAKRKWVLLRDSFRRIKRKNDSRTTDAGVANTFPPKWKWYGAMEFLRSSGMDALSRPKESVRGLDEEDLIDEVRRRPNLYDPRHARYRDREATLNSWKEIGQQLGVNVSICKKRWIKLQSDYLRDTMSKDPPDIRATSNPYYVLLDFLSEKVDAHEDDYGSQDDLGDDQIKQEVTMEYAPAIDASPNSTVEVMEATESCEQPANATDDDFEADRHFLLSLLPMFRRLSPLDNLDVRIQIQSVIKAKLFPPSS